jgi:hypothetical protein
MLGGMARDDDDPSWARQLLVAAVVLVAVALVIGGVVSLVAVGAAKVTGIGSSGTASAEPTLYIPSHTPTTKPEQQRLPGGSAGSSASPSTGPDGHRHGRQNRHRQHRSHRSRITLHASPSRVSAGQRINLTGRYRGGGGARLRVQRFEGGWSDFPVTVTVRGGAFATYVLTGRTGVNRFRVVDPSSGRSSNEVRVTVR